MTHYYSPTLNNREKQIIIGTILGGSSIVKPKKGRNCYLSMRCKNGQWLDFKSAELSRLASTAPITIEKTFRWHSLCYPIFNELRESFYKNGKRKLNADNLNPLTDVGLAIWYGDCGTYQRENVILNTSVWGKEGSEIIVSYFNNCFFNSYETNDRNGWRVVLDENSSKKFLSLVGPWLPSIHQK